MPRAPAAAVKNLNAAADKIKATFFASFSLTRKIHQKQEGTAMNQHLAAIRAYHDALSIPQAEYGLPVEASDMDIILRQALLMDGGSETFKAIKSGEMAAILAGLTNLAYYALGAIALSGNDVSDEPVGWRHDGFVLSVMKLLSEEIDRCKNGDAQNYSALYCLCSHLTKAFLNADFNGAFQCVHANNMARLDAIKNADRLTQLQLPKTPDLSEFMYE